MIERAASDKYDRTSRRDYEIITITAAIWRWDDVIQRFRATTARPDCFVARIACRNRSRM